MDRNTLSENPMICVNEVALRKESVDRNIDPDADTLTDDVALRKESVDRNTGVSTHCQAIPGSLSARRAWIEIVAFVFGFGAKLVALRKESVDRNCIMGMT